MGEYLYWLISTVLLVSAFLYLRTFVMDCNTKKPLTVERITLWLSVFCLAVPVVRVCFVTAVLVVTRVKFATGELSWSFAAENTIIVKVLKRVGKFFEEEI